MEVIIIFLKILILVFISGVIILLSVYVFRSADTSIVLISIAPENLKMYKSEQQQFSAVIKYSDKTWNDITELAEWSTPNISIIDVNNSGMIIALKEGQAKLYAKFGSERGETRVFVRDRIDNVNQ